MGNLQSQGGGKRHGDSRPRNGRARSSGSLQFGMSRSEEDVREKTKEKSHSFSGLKDSLRRSFRVPSRDEQERRPKGKPKDRSQVVMGSWAGGEDAGRKKRSNSRDSGGGHRQASRTCSTGSSRSGSGRQSGGSVRRTASTGSSRRGSAGSRKSSGKRTNDGKSFISYFT
ncbi:RNA-binding protein with serine-rich domain 1-like isoform X2 [Branchiostoma lanceolatum]|uniref:RNA-binding protein with serine-rich domain 1-like isoform X2 n=1 Tax=Branchiostoma lanceolatum TaxID=7740 RepID=UPI0034518F04